MPKRWSNLINETDVSIELCKKCIADAAKGKTGKKSTAKIRRILKNTDKYAKRLRNMILDPENRLHLHKYRNKTIRENKKTRVLDIPEFWPDQCVHHVLIDLIKDKAIKRVDPCAMACVDGRGTDTGIHQLENWIRYSDKPGYVNKFKVDMNKKKMLQSKYVMKADIYHCFPSLKTSIIYEEFCKFIKDPKYLYCIKQVLDNSETLPIGISMSGWFFNLMMKDFDDIIRNYPGTTHYMRYMDDFVIFAKTRNELKALRPIIDKSLTKYGLRLKAGTTIYEVSKHGVDLMGHRVKRNVTIRRKSSWKVVRHDILKVERFLYDNMVNLRVINDIIFTINHFSPSFFVTLQSRIGACHLDSNAHLRKFMHTPGINELFRNATRMNVGKNPISGKTEITYFDTRRYQRDMEKSRFFGKKEVMHFIEPPQSPNTMILHVKEAIIRKRKAIIKKAIDVELRRRKNYFSSIPTKPRKNIIFREGRKRIKINVKKFIDDNPEMYGFSYRTSVQHILEVDRIAMEKRREREMVSLAKPQ